MFVSASKSGLSLEVGLSRQWSLITGLPGIYTQPLPVRCFPGIKKCGINDNVVGCRPRRRMSKLLHLNLVLTPSTNSLWTTADDGRMTDEHRPTDVMISNTTLAHLGFRQVN